MMDEEYWDAEYWEHVRRCDENGKATANNMPNDAIISVLHAALIVYITECREVDDADGEMYARQAQEWLDNLPQPPEPDWSEAPEWAQWWAVDADGTAVWYEAEPFVWDPFMWDWEYTPHTQNRIDKILHIPIGIDWRTTLRKRPEASNDPR